MPTTTRRPTPPVPVLPGPARRERGFTILEVTLAALILSTIMLITFRLLLGSSTLLRTVSSGLGGDTTASFIAQQIADHFQNVGRGRLDLADGTYAVYDFPAGATANAGFRAQEVIGYQGGANPTPLYGRSWGISLVAGEAIDNVDNDRDRIIDEYDVFLQEWPAAPNATPKVTRLAQNVGGYDNFTNPLVPVTYAPVRVVRTGNQLEFTVTVFRYDPTNQMVRRYTATRTMLMRN